MEIILAPEDFVLLQKLEEDWEEWSEVPGWHSMWFRKLIIHVKRLNQCVFPMPLLFW